MTLLKDPFAPAQESILVVFTAHGVPMFTEFNSMQISVIHIELLIMDIVTSILTLGLNDAHHQMKKIVFISQIKDFIEHVYI